MREHAESTPVIVDRPRLERMLASIRPLSTDPRAGLFGPDSLSWRIDRESAVFLGAARAGLLQVAHPAVAAAVTEHASLAKFPLGRFQRTFVTVFSMVFGTTEQAFEASRRLHALHSRITGWVPAEGGYPPQRYHANDVSALLWVQATLVETALRVHELVFAPLTSAERERHYRESKLFAKLMGIADEDMPEDAAAFMAYNERMWSSQTLRSTESTHRLGALLLYGSRSSRPPFVVPPGYRALTLSLLPRSILDLYGLTFGAREARRATRALRRVRLGYPLLPKKLRFVPPYQEAMLRLRGQGRPGYTLRLLNRLWVGRPTLVSSPLVIDGSE